MHNLGWGWEDENPWSIETHQERALRAILRDHWFGDEEKAYRRMTRLINEHEKEQ